VVKRMFAERKLVRVYFDAAQYARIEARAHGNVSAYLRDLALREGERETEAIPDVQSAVDVRSPARRDVVSTAASPLDRLPAVGERRAVAKSAARTCAHGVAKGYNCWQCGGLANVVQS
jgi:hypothetical protein